MSRTWKFCPNCGGDLEDGSPVTPKIKQGQRDLSGARAAPEAESTRPDGSVRKSPLKGRKPALAAADRPKLCQHKCTRGPMKGKLCGALNKPGHRHRYVAKQVQQTFDPGFDVKAALADLKVESD